MSEKMNIPRQDSTAQPRDYGEDSAPEEREESIRKAIDDMANESVQDPEFFDRIRELRAREDEAENRQSEER